MDVPSLPEELKPLYELTLDYTQNIKKGGRRIGKNLTPVVHGGFAVQFYLWMKNKDIYRLYRKIRPPTKDVDILIYLPKSADLSRRTFGVYSKRYKLYLINGKRGAKGEVFVERVGKKGPEKSSRTYRVWRNRREVHGIYLPEPHVLFLQKLKTYEARGYKEPKDLLDAFFIYKAFGKELINAAKQYLQRKGVKDAFKISREGFEKGLRVLRKNIALRGYGLTGDLEDFAKVVYGLYGF